MNAFGWILLLIVIGCIVTLLIITLRRKDKKEDEHTKAAPAVTSTVMKGQEEDNDEGRPQVTIYAYRSAPKMQLCAVCDGENNATATHCRICGQQLK